MCQRRHMNNVSCWQYSEKRKKKKEKKKSSEKNYSLHCARSQFFARSVLGVPINYIILVFLVNQWVSLLATHFFPVLREILYVHFIFSINSVNVTTSPFFILFFYVNGCFILFYPKIHISVTTQCRQSPFLSFICWETIVSRRVNACTLMSFLQ